MHGFAHQSGGTVTIASELGQGTRITLYLPRAEVRAEQLAAEPAAQPAEGGSVLLVEDNPEVAEVSALLLEQLGYRVKTAGDAEAALAAIEREAFDLVVSDIVMAGALDGIGLARVHQCAVNEGLTSSASLAIVTCGFAVCFTKNELAGF